MQKGLSRPVQVLLVNAHTWLIPSRGFTAPLGTGGARGFVLGGNFLVASQGKSPPPPYATGENTPFASALPGL